MFILGTRKRCRKMSLPLVIFLVIFPKLTSLANHFSLRGVQYPYIAPSPSISHGSKNGAMQEQECYVARLCEYKIYENFSCKVSKYVISQGYERILPKWLWFDEENKTLKGIPSPSDEGVIEIVIIGLTRHQDSPGRHICTLQSITMVVWSLNYFPLFGFAQNFRTSVAMESFSKTSTWQSITCQFNEPIILASLVFAGDFQKMAGKQKICFLGDLLSSYHISMYDVFVLSGKDSMLSFLHTSNVVASGPGANRSASGPRTVITWHVKCGVIHLEDSLLKAVEELSQQSIIINNVNYAPIGWHVVSGFQNHHVRKRRNVVGTTTPAYSTIPISRATVITTKIKSRKTTYVGTTLAFTLSRPLPTFSSPFIDRNTSLYSQSKTVGIQISQTTTSHNKSVRLSLTLPAMSQSRHLSATVSYISPDSQRSEIPSYKSVRTNLPVMSSSNSLSSLSQISTTRQQISEMGQSTKTSSETHLTSTIASSTRLTTTSYLLSSRLSRFTKPSLTTSPSQKSTYSILPSSRSVASSIPPTVQSIINNSLLATGLSTPKMHSTSQQNNSTTNTAQPSYSSSVNMSSGTYSSALHATSSDIVNITKSAAINQTLYKNLSSAADTKSIKATTASKFTNVSETTRFTTTSLLASLSGTARSTTSSKPTSIAETRQPTTMASLSSKVAETTQRFIAALTSTNVPGTTRSTTASKSTNVVETKQPSTMASQSTNVSYTTKPSTMEPTSTNIPVSTRSPTSSTFTNTAETAQRSHNYSFYSPFTSAENSYTTATLFISCTNSCSVSMFSTAINLQHTSPYLATSITSPYLATSIARERLSSSFRVDKTPVLNTTSVMSQTSGKVKKTRSTIPVLTSAISSKSPKSSEYSSKIMKTATSSNTIQLSSLGTKSTIQVSSSVARTSELSSGSKVSTFTSISLVTLITSTGRTHLTVTSQTGSKTKVSVSPVSSPTFFSTTTVHTPTEKIKSTYSSSINTSPTSTYIFSLVQRETIQSSSLHSNAVPNTFTSHTSGMISAASSTIHTDARHRSLSDSLALSGSVSQSFFQSQTNRILSSFLVSISSRQRSPNISTSRITTATSLSDLVSSTHISISPSSVATISSFVLLSSHQTPTLPSSHITNTPSLKLSFYPAGTLPSVVTSRISSSVLPTYHTTISPTVGALIISSDSPSSLSSNGTTTRSTDLISSSKSDTLLAVPTTLSDQISSYPTPSSSLVGITNPSYSYLTNTSSTVFSSPVFTVTNSSVYLSHNIPTSPSNVVAISTSDVVSTYLASTSITLAAITSTSELLSSAHFTTLLSTGVTTTRSLDFSSPNVATLLSAFPSSYLSSVSSSTAIITTPSSRFLSSNHQTNFSSTSFTTVISDLPSTSSHTTTSTSSTLTTSHSLGSLSSYHKTSSSSTIHTIISSNLSLSHTTSLSPCIVCSIRPVESLSFYPLTSSSTVLATATSVSAISSYRTSTSTSPVFNTTPLSDRTSSYHNLTSLFTSVAQHFFTTFQSHHAPTLKSPATTYTYVSTSQNLSTSYISTSLSSAVTVTRSPVSPFSPRSFLTSQENLPTSAAPSSSPLYQTFSMSFLSSSIVPSQLSASADHSMMVRPTVESFISHTLTKLSKQTDAFKVSQPSYTSGDIHRTTPILSYTSMKNQVAISSARIFPSSTSSDSSSSFVTLPTTRPKESPKVYNHFDLLRVTVGKVFNEKIPVDTFHDREDGNTRNLMLQCLTVDKERLSSGSWLQFNSTTQTLYGLVLKNQLDEIGASSEFVLTASDHDGNTVYDAFTVEIDESRRLLAAMFSVKLTGTNLELFNSDLNNLLSVVQTIAGYYGDKDESMIQVLTLEESSVIFSWSNTSLVTCNEELINDLARKIMTSSGDIQPYFSNALSPRFVAEEVFLNFTGPCIVPTTRNPRVSKLSSHEISPLLKYVLPAIVVAVVVVIAVTCLLVKRRSGSKVLKEDKQTFKRRKPIILDGELEMSTLSGKPIELPEDSFTPIRFPQETSLGMPDTDDISELLSPVLHAPSFQRLPPEYSDGSSNRYNTPPPPYKLPPSYSV